ncbi:hypothetical protein DZK34_00125 [Chlamydia abortus]|nr:hypothetical protein DZK34_00125 [Chlamydia abortus]
MVAGSNPARSEFLKVESYQIQETSPFFLPAEFPQAETGHIRRVQNIIESLSKGGRVYNLFIFHNF